MQQVLALVLLVTMSGCGLFSGADNYASYKDMYTSFADSKTTRGNALAVTPCPADPIAAAYCNSSKMLGQAFLSLERFDLVVGRESVRLHRLYAVR